MKCELCEDKLLEYLYGELGEEDAAAMGRHLEASDACRQAYEGFASVLDTVAEEGEEGPSPALHTRIMGHAEEARPGRRSLWAWMFRPAVTTAVIGAVAAGVYFTSLRHKPPSLLDERTLSEQSPVRKLKQRSTPPSSGAKVDALKKEAKDKGFLTSPAESPSNAKVDSLGKEADDQGFPARLAESEPRQTIEREEAASEPFEVPEKKGSVRITPPSGRRDRSVPMNSLDEDFALERARPPEKKSQFTAVGSVDEELAPAPPLRKSDAKPADEDRAVAGGMERAPSPPHETRAVPRALSTAPGRVLTYEEAPVPDAIAQAQDLASKGQCIEAGKIVEAYTTDHPKEKASGAGWLEVAHCHEKKGDTKAAREIAEKALEIPDYKSEARAYLDSLPP